MAMRSVRAIGLLFAYFVGATALSADEPKGDAVKKEMDKLQGVWVWRAHEQEGKENNSERAEATSRGQLHTVKGNKWETKYKFGDKVYTFSGTVKIDPTTTPKSIDFTFDNTPNAGKTMKGVFEVDGNELRLCWGQVGKDDRPKTVRTKKGSAETVQLYKRQ
jgi:uncharacterized protein (TIGR03067 family)